MFSNPLNYGLFYRAITHWEGALIGKNNFMSCFSCGTFYVFCEFSDFRKKRYILGLLTYKHLVGISF